MSAAAIRGEAPHDEISAWEAAEAQRLLRSRVETEPLHAMPRSRRRLASGTGYLSAPRGADASKVSRADTVEDFRVSSKD